MLRAKPDPRLVLITGAGSGIGRATALRYAERGATVVVTDIDGDTASATAQMIRARGGSAVVYVLDVTDDNAWQQLAAEVSEQHGVPDILVNNAGFGIAGGFLEHTKSDWDRLLAVNLDGVVNGCRAYAPRMAERGSGQIINIASGLGYIPWAMTPSYCTSKAAVRMFSECLRVELAPKRVGVTVICPGVVGGTAIVSNARMVASLDDMESIEKGEFQRVAGFLVEKFGSKFSSPDYVARGIVRAGQHNWAVVPVRPESWLMFALHRLSPGLLRGGAALLAPRRVEQAVAAVSTRIPQRWVDVVRARVDR
ncbi:SDR family NAD(P)-dependent oxidoreductase [Nocardia brasiliensis]|uniref:SDR family NAD(P)-dependent oxidoreductase n=1 Tax=Nocardia brasiliensis TaxID=37326 RepID=A0A6G9Y389_NOCBR|nr:SDR family NAD(P)-dependent oxidoreductase [Nocardia brasiliensis]QIS07543.1 SDR family NAD(P)-dependent oxidoreductase [Nocardia brasiliensis]